MLWTEPRINLGNFMYHWLYAHTAQEGGRDVVVRHIPEMDQWIPYFPLTQRLTIQQRQIRISDRRAPGYFQLWHYDYLPSSLEVFADAMISSTTLPLRQDNDPQRLVVNIRRGDFLSPEFADRFAFNQDGYLRAALERSRRVGGPIERIHIVSDDVTSCRAAFPWLTDEAQVTFASPEPTPVQDFIELASARRLVLTNSTFGYWAAHFSNRLHRNHEHVVVPWFHDRSMAGGWAYQINPTWTVVKDVPGGWDPA